MGKTVKLPISNFLLDEPHAHADKLWGPYPSLEAAAAAIPTAMKVASFKFGVLSGGVFSEYIYLEDNGTPQELASLKVQLLLNPASGAVAGKILSLNNELKPIWVDPSSTAERVSFDNSEEIFDGNVATTQAAIEALKDLLDVLDGDVVKGILVNGSEVSIENGVVSITIPDAVTSVIANNELVFQTPDGQSVKGKVGVTTGADGLLHLTLTDEEGHTYSSPIAGLRVDGNALQYSNDGEIWTTVQTFGKLTIKYVQASDPASGDEGDLALVGSTNAYVLKVYVGGSWVSVCDFGTLDLTSDGITIAGESKTLTEFLGIRKEVTEGYDILKPEIQKGYFNSSRIDTNQSSPNRYTIINLLAGEKIRLTGVTKTSFGRIGTYSNGSASNVTMGTSPTDTDFYETEYEAQEDISIILGFASNFPYLIEKWTATTKQTNTLDTLQSDVNDLKESLDMVGGSESTVEENVELSEHLGYWGLGNNISRPVDQDSGDNRYSDFIEFKKGDVLSITCFAATNTSMIVRKDYYEEGVYRRVMTGTGASETTLYTVPYDGEYSFTWKNTDGIVVKKITTSTSKSSAALAELSNRIDEIPENIGATISQAVDERIADIGIESTIEDDLTEDIEEGHFINTSGGIGDNQSFGYKLYNVKAGTEITFTAKFHGNLCPIARKIDDSRFELLVETPGQVTTTVTYTATSDMVVALSCYINEDRSATLYANKLNEIEHIKQEIEKTNKKILNVDIEYGLLFDKIAVIGDSLSVGTLNETTGEDAHIAGGSFGCSWLTCLAKKWGSSIRQHYATGGANCWTWLGGNVLEKPTGSSEIIITERDGNSNASGLGLMLNDTGVYDVYFIAMGHNDAGKYPIGELSDNILPLVQVASHSEDQDGKINDVVSTEGNSTTHNVKITSNSYSSVTFYSLYKTIVNFIRAKAPNALIFMLSTEKKDDDAAFGYMNQPIKELAEWYYEQGDHKVFYVDYINRYVQKDGYWHGSHWSTFGYVNVARLINEAMNEVIEENLNTNALKVWGNYLNSSRCTKINTTETGSSLPHL